jgi:hypothetical protein
LRRQSEKPPCKPAIPTTLMCARPSKPTRLYGIESVMRGVHRKDAADGSARRPRVGAPGR